jgi:hypothetical protein
MSLRRPMPPSVWIFSRAGRLAVCRHNGARFHIHTVGRGGWGSRRAVAIPSGTLFDAGVLVTD